MPSKAKKSFPSALQIVADQWTGGRAFTLAAAVEMDVFTSIDVGDGTARDVASRANANETSMRRFLDVMVAMKYLTRRGGRYALTSVAATYLSRKSELFMTSFPELTRMQSMGWQQLSEVVRSGKPVLGEASPSPAGFFQVLVRNIFPQNYIGAKSAVRAIAPAARRRIQNILDIGGGAGAWSIAFAQEIIRAEVTLVDFPEVIGVAREYAEAYGVSARFQYQEGNFREVEFGTDRFDLAILGHIVHGEGAEWGQRLIARCAAALRSKGMLLIAEFIPNDDRTGPPLSLLFDLNMMIYTAQGAVFTMREYRQWLKDAGFAAVKAIKSLHTPSPLILATKA